MIKTIKSWCVNFKNQCDHDEWEFQHIITNKKGGLKLKTIKGIGWRIKGNRKINRQAELKTQNRYKIFIQVGKERIAEATVKEKLIKIKKSFLIKTYFKNSEGKQIEHICHTLMEHRTISRAESWESVADLSSDFYAPSVVAICSSFGQWVSCHSGSQRTYQAGSSESTMTGTINWK